MNVRYRRCILIALLFAVVLPVAFFARSCSAQYASVTFLCISNVSFGSQYAGSCAVFRLTNGTRAAIGYCAESVEVKTDSGWRTTTLQCTPSNWYGFGAHLHPAESRLFYVPPPTSNGVWRVHITCNERSAGVSGLRDRVNDYLLNRRNVGNARMTTFGGSKYQITSEVVEP